MDTKQNCRNWHALGTDPVKQQLFLLNYYEARQEKLTKERIIRSWKLLALIHLMLTKC